MNRTDDWIYVTNPPTREVIDQTPSSSAEITNFGLVKYKDFMDLSSEDKELLVVVNRGTDMSEPYVPPYKYVQSPFSFHGFNSGSEAESALLCAFYPLIFDCLQS